MNNQEEALGKVIGEELIDTTIDLTMDYSELYLDAFIEEGLLKEIPIVKSVFAVVKTGLRIKENYFIKKILTFLKEFHTAQLSEEKRLEFKNKFKEDKKYQEAVLEQIIILTDRFLEIEKSKILANLFSSHINGMFDWEGFCDLSVCLDNLHLRGVKLIEQLEHEETPFETIKVGWNEYEGLLTSAGIVMRLGQRMKINEHGQYLYHYGIKGKINTKINVH